MTLYEICRHFFRNRCQYFNSWWPHSVCLSRTHCSMSTFYIASKENPTFLIWQIGNHILFGTNSVCSFVHINGEFDLIWTDHRQTSLKESHTLHPSPGIINFWAWHRFTLSISFVLLLKHMRTGAFRVNILSMAISFELSNFAYDNRITITGALCLIPFWPMFVCVLLILFFSFNRMLCSLEITLSLGKSAIRGEYATWSGFHLFFFVLRKKHNGQNVHIALVFSSRCYVWFYCCHREHIWAARIEAENCYNRPFFSSTTPSIVGSAVQEVNNTLENSVFLLEHKRKWIHALELWALFYPTICIM